MKTWISVAVGFIATTIFSTVSAQALVPFKLGTFQRGNETFVGMVLRDSTVVHIAQANAAVERSTRAAKMRTPRDMKELISRYDEIRPRLQAIAAANDSGQRSGYAYDLKSVKILPPIM